MKTYEKQGYKKEDITWDLIDRFNSKEACAEVTFDFCAGDKEWVVFCGLRNWLLKIRKAHDKEAANFGESKIVLDDVDFYEGEPRGFFFTMPLKYQKLWTPKFMSDEKKAEAAERARARFGLNNASNSAEDDDVDEIIDDEE